MADPYQYRSFPTFGAPGIRKGSASSATVVMTARILKAPGIPKKFQMIAPKLDGAPMGSKKSTKGSDIRSFFFPLVADHP